MFTTSKVLVSIVLVLALASTAQAGCQPDCRWQCDNPVCPAVCHPVCEKPKCEMQCEDTPCAKCTVHCNRPECDIRCPKNMCDEPDCPTCESVCNPANCYTTCVAPEPVCGPVCEETECAWNCEKPTMCPKPKCELVCDKSDCAYEEPTEDEEDKEEECCSCHVDSHAAAAMELAGESEEVVPSLLEVLDNFRMHHENGNKQCCPCAKK